MPSKPKSIAFKSKVEKFTDFSMYYLEVPAKAIKALGGKFRLRLICTVNKKISFQCGLMALGEGRGYITLAKKRMEELGAGLGSPLKVELRPDASKYGMKVPAEFLEVLRQDNEGRKRFDALSPGKKRTMLFYISGTKNVDLRIERSLRMLENLKLLPKGKETIPGIFGKRASPGSGRW